MKATTCPDEELMMASSIAAQDARGALAQVTRLLATYGSDPKLHFLQGSLLAGLLRFAEARDAMQIAVTLDPRYSIARFQLGLLALTSGQGEQAAVIWRPLESLDPGDPLRLFAAGLSRLAADDFQTAVRLIEDGMRNNPHNTPLNHDMKMVVDAVLEMNKPGRSTTSAEDAVSSTQMLLSRFQAKSTQH
jgi:Flp pilus assembly protein TadD